jgi:virginiamycin B lyase
VIFDESTTNKIGQFNLLTHQFTEYTVPTPLSVPWGVTLGPDGAIWFTEYTGNKIGRIDPVTGRITEYPIATLAYLEPNPGSIIPAADGGLWVAEGTTSLGHRIGRFDSVTKTYTAIATPTPLSEPCDLKASSDGHTLWFGEYNGNKVGAIRV